MKKNALTVTVAILLIMYALINLGAALGQFSKAKAVSGTTSAVVSLGELAGDTRGATDVKKEGRELSAVLYLIALFILFTAVLELVTAVGLFGGQNWAFTALILASICGALVEMQDTAEDGFGIGKLIFFTINALALIAAFAGKEQELVGT